MSDVAFLVGALLADGAALWLVLRGMVYVAERGLERASCLEIWRHWRRDRALARATAKKARTQ